MGKAIRYFQAIRVPPIPGQPATVPQINHVLEIDDIVIVLYADGTVEYEWSERLDQVGLSISSLQSTLPEKMRSILGARWRGLPDPSDELVLHIRTYLEERDKLAEMKSMHVVGLFPSLSMNESETLVTAVEDDRE